MAVAARPLHMLYGDRRRIELQGAGQGRAQRIDALAMRPHLQMAVAVHRQPAGRPDRGMGDVHPRVGRLVGPRRGRRIGGRRAVGLVDRGLLQQPARLFLKRVQCLDIVPGDMARRDGSGGFDDGFVRADNGEKIAVADDLDRAFGGTADRRLVDGPDRRAAARLAHDSGMHHAVERQIVQECRPAEHLVGKIDARQAVSDHPMLARFFDGGAAGCVSGEIDGGGERPVILAGRLAAMQDRAVIDRQLGAGMAGLRCRVVEKQPAHLGAGQAQCDAAELDRLAAGGIALVRSQLGVAGLQQDALGGDVEFLGRDLAHRGQHALADLDPAGRHGDVAGHREPHPLIESRIVPQHAGQGRGCGGAHRAAPCRICAAARSTARRIRACEPQRQILSSSATAISCRDGAGLRSSKALAVIRMPGRQ